MNGGLDGALAAVQSGARACAETVVAPVAIDIDRSGRVPSGVWPAVQAVLAASANHDAVSLVVVVEELAVGSAAVALAAAGASLGMPIVESEYLQWPGLRGADVDGLRTRGAGNPAWDVAVTGVMIGIGRATLDVVLPVLRDARRSGQPNEWAHGPLADAATALDAARLLLWDAVTSGREELADSAARGMARLQALDAMALATTAAERATAAEAARPGTALERLHRDAATVARVFGEMVSAQLAVTNAR